MINKIIVTFPREINLNREQQKKLHDLIYGLCNDNSTNLESMWPFMVGLQDNCFQIHCSIKPLDK